MKKHKFLAAYMAVLLAFTTYVTLDTFVITRVYGEETSGGSALEDPAVQNDQADGNELPAEEGLDTDSFSADSSGNNGSGSEGTGKHAGGHARRKGPGSRHGKSDAPGSGYGSGSSDSDSSLSSGSTGESYNGSSGDSSTTSDSYKDSNIQMTLKEYRQNDSTIYVADVIVSSPEYLKTALAQGSYGRNVTGKTSEIASTVNAILAINGDYYGAQEKGYVIRNGTLYRNTAYSGSEDLVIYSDGSFGIINESEVSAEQLIADGVVQNLSFGPALISNGNIAVTQDEEVGKAMASNPRTAIGIIDKCHYVFVVSDGRTSESAGLSLYQLAEFMDSLGVETAYNLDGGGSSTMYFNGQVVNNPTSGGSIKERSVSDIVYIGY